MGISLKRNPYYIYGLESNNDLIRLIVKEFNFYLKKGFLMKKLLLVIVIFNIFYIFSI